MAPLAKLAVFASLFSNVFAHFILQIPPNIGFDDDNEPNGPCGGFTPSFSSGNITDFHVGGDTIMALGAHPTITYIFRATLTEDASGGWQPLTGSDIQVVGLNLACNPDVPAPPAFAGNKGIIQVIADSPDGILFQCAVVNFVAGTATGPAKGCTNSTGVTMSYTNDNTLDSTFRTGSSGASSSGTATATAAASSKSASSTATKSSSATPGYITPGSSSLGLITWVVLVAAGTMAFRLL